MFPGFDFTQPLSGRSTRGILTFKPLKVVLFCCVLVASAAGQVRQQSDIKDGQSAPARADARFPVPPDATSPQAENKVSRKVIPDVEVINQEGKRLHFYADLVRDKIVVINFIYTTCMSVCPMQGEHLAALQQFLGERLGRDVNIISISSDPQTDTPRRLKAWATRYRARAGWTLVTGSVSNIDQLTSAFTQTGATKGLHSPVVYIGNDRKGAWFSANGLVGPKRWQEYLELAAAASQQP